MVNIFLGELKRVLKDRPTFLLGIALIGFSVTAFLQMASIPEQSMQETIDQTVWYSENTLDQLNAELKLALQLEPSSVPAKEIAVAVGEQSLQIRQNLAQKYQGLQKKESTEKEFSEAAWQADIAVMINENIFYGRPELNDADPISYWNEKLDWLALPSQDYNTYASISENWQGFDAEIKHDYFVGRTKLIEKMILEYEHDIPYSLVRKGPVTFAKTYFSSGCITGYLLPIVIIAYFGMCALSLIRNRALFLSRTLPVSSFSYLLIQVVAEFVAFMILFGITFGIGFFVSGFCFGWTDLFCFEFISSGLWSSYGVEAGQFPSLTQMESYFTPVSARAPVPSGDLLLIQAWTLLLVYLALIILLISSGAVVINSISFLLPEKVALGLLGIIIALVMISRSSFSPVNLFSVAWPSVVDMAAGGVGVGWGVWIGCNLMLSALMLMLDKIFLHRKDV